MSDQPMTPHEADVRLRQYGERTKTWSTATYDSGTEKTLHEIALTLQAEVNRLRQALAEGVGPVVRSVHQRGHAVEMPLELLEYLTGGAESAAVADSDALPRDRFEVVADAIDSKRVTAEWIRCLECGSPTTQAGLDGKGWTLARLDLMADRHRCMPRVSAEEGPSGKDRT